MENEKKVEALKKKLTDKWQNIKNRYPVIQNSEAVGNDLIKKDFLNYIDGLRSVEEIRNYFTLDMGEAQIIFGEFIDSGAIRFLEEIERPRYLKQQNIELKRSYDFLLARRDSLKGEELYYYQQIQSKKKDKATVLTKIPEMQKIKDDFEKKLNDLKGIPSGLWQANAELTRLKKEMLTKETQINKILEEFETGLPLLVKRKLNLAEQIRSTNSRFEEKKHENTQQKKQLFYYREAIDKIKNSLTETKIMVKEWQQEKY